MKYEHIGWYQEGKHDKVWGIIRLQGFDCVIFWGRRGAKLQTKLIKASVWETGDLFDKKRKKGYQSVREYELNEVYPEFQQDLEQTAFWATFKL
jgi:predicted DNA-binding WGR domain protein